MAGTCKHCGAEMLSQETYCRLCGRSSTEPIQSVAAGGRVAKWPLAAAVAVIVLGIASAGWYIRRAQTQIPLQESTLINPVPAPVQQPPLQDDSPLPPVDVPGATELPTPEPVPNVDDTRRIPERRLPGPIPQDPSVEQAAITPVAPPIEERVQRFEPSPARETETTPPLTGARPRVVDPFAARLPVQPAPPVTPPPPPLPVAHEGTVIWSGPLSKGQVVTIDNSGATSGELHGTLPGAPVLISVAPPDMGIVEMPGPSNGWKRLALRSNSKRNSVVTIHWSLLQ